MTRVLYQSSDHVAAQQLHGQPTRLGITVGVAAALGATGVFYLSGIGGGMAIWRFIPL